MKLNYISYIVASTIWLRGQQHYINNIQVLLLIIQVNSQSDVFIKGRKKCTPLKKNKTEYIQHVTQVHMIQKLQYFAPVHTAMSESKTITLTCRNYNFINVSKHPVASCPIDKFPETTCSRKRPRISIIKLTCQFPLIC